jgi:hypothetical protein
MKRVGCEWSHASGLFLVMKCCVCRYSLLLYWSACLYYMECLWNWEHSFWSIAGMGSFDPSYTPLGGDTLTSFFISNSERIRKDHRVVSTVAESCFEPEIYRNLYPFNIHRQFKWSNITIFMSYLFHLYNNKYHMKIKIFKLMTVIIGIPMKKHY